MLVQVTLQVLWKMQGTGCNPGSNLFRLKHVGVLNDSPNKNTMFYVKTRLMLQDQATLASAQEAVSSTQRVGLSNLLGELGGLLDGLLGLDGNLKVGGGSLLDANIKTTIGRKKRGLLGGLLGGSSHSPCVNGVLIKYGIHINWFTPNWDQPGLAKTQCDRVEDRPVSR
ncbi:unnamed protein product [Spodoptera exigua]|nr:unnamed protein product [Spodoptera exigua]